MAEFIGSEHTNVVLDTPALAEALYDSTRVRDLPGMADVDSSLYLFCGKIKERFPVALSGECADEIFAGYPWYHRKEVLFYDGFPWSTAVPERASLMKNPMTACEAEEYVRRSYDKCLSQVEYLDSDNETDRRMREMFMLNMDYFMATLLDRKDRMSMAHGLEVRVPFCDYRIAEYLYNVPWEYKDWNGYEKGLLRTAMQDVLPPEVLWRKKSPYPKTHNPSYLRAVSEMLQKVLDAPDAPVLQIVRREMLEQLLDGEESVQWYGQLMTRPQIMAYFVQMDYWMRKYQVKVVF